MIDFYFYANFAYRRTYVQENKAVSIIIADDLLFFSY
jgi:hypothetical protein